MQKETQIYKPKAFISCSVREQDKSFVELVESIVIEQGFDPMGTVGRYVNYAEPIPRSMVKEMKKADVVVMAATPRYEQKEINTQKGTERSISEMLHVESGMAVIAEKPVMVFVQKGTNVGNFIPGITQYFEFDTKSDFEVVKTQVTSMFNDVKQKCIKKVKEADKKEMFGWAKNVFAFIGLAFVAITVWNSIFRKE